MTKKSNPLYERARCSYYDQTKRCNNPKNPLYKWYGQKGVKVEYSLNDFLSWYYKNAIGFERPTVDRIDHDKNYSFENIRIVEKSDNSKERIQRLGTPIPRRPILMIGKNGEITEYESAYHAAKSNPQLHVPNIGHCCRGKRKKHKGFSFKYKE